MYAIGFDIGGTKCAVSIGELGEGSIRVLGRYEVPTTTPHETMDALLPQAIAWKKESRGSIPGSTGESGLVSRGSQGLRSPLESRRGSLGAP